mgnify:CR=1 FL=1
MGNFLKLKGPPRKTASISFSIPSATEMPNATDASPDALDASPAAVGMLLLVSMLNRYRDFFISSDAFNFFLIAILRALRRSSSITVCNRAVIFISLPFSEIVSSSYSVENFTVVNAGFKNSLPHGAEDLIKCDFF